MDNKGLKQVYDQMHQQGQSAWYGDGREERELILKMGKPWYGCILEIGCGEGWLGDKLCDIQDIEYYKGIDYSKNAIEMAKRNFPHIEDNFEVIDYRNLNDGNFNRLVMQGVLEHLDDPFTELKWMMDNLLAKKGDVITSSPCFLNPRGIVWMTLNMLGAVMSKTDLHYLDPHEFFTFAYSNGYKIDVDYCDDSWGNGLDMILDFEKRLPLALRDGGITYDNQRLDEFLRWLSNLPVKGLGATAVYRISK